MFREPTVEIIARAISAEILKELVPRRPPIPASVLGETIYRDDPP